MALHKPGKLYLVRPSGEKIVVDEGLKFPNGVTISPDQTQLYATESASHWVWIYKIKPDGTLTYKQRYGWLHVPDTEENAWSDGIKMRYCRESVCNYKNWNPGVGSTGTCKCDYSGATIQWANIQCYVLADLILILLYVSCGDKVFRRKLRTQGANTFAAPIKPVNPRM